MNIIGKGHNLIIILVITILCDKESQHVFNLYLALSYDFISVIPDVFPPWSLMRENEYKVVAQAKLYILMINDNEATMPLEEYA